MKQNPLEGNSCLATEEIPCCLWNWKIQDHFHKNKCLWTLSYLWKCNVIETFGRVVVTIVYHFTVSIVVG